jgi:zinc finger CCHC domain-containing protein 9
MVRVTDFARPKPTHDKDDPPRRPLPSQTSAFQSQRPSSNPRSEARRLKRKSIRESDKECYVCRQTGHLSQDCPKNVNGETRAEVGRICYRCGRIDHSLKDCKKPQIRQNNREGNVSENEDDTETTTEFLPYANCYVCNKSGHLAGSCPQNERGIFPNGGGCKLCGHYRCVYAN